MAYLFENEVALLVFSGGLTLGLLVFLLAYTLPMRWVVPALILLVVLQAVRPTYDADRNPSHVIRSAGLVQPLRLLKTMPELRVLALATFFYAGTQILWICIANPNSPGRTGDRSFFSDHTGVIRFEPSGVATGTSPPLD